MAKWIDFLRKYGPIPTNDNMYDESIQRAAKRHGAHPILFDHPFKQRIEHAFSSNENHNIILTGTAGDGKTHLCREIWSSLQGSREQWASDEPHLKLHANGTQYHFIRDLSAWAPSQGQLWSELPDKHRVALQLCRSLVGEGSDSFVVAANDGQLVEALRKLSEEDPSGVVSQTKDGIESLLVNDMQDSEELNLSLFNLSRGSSAKLFDLALEAVLTHPGWEECRDSDIPGLWAESCSIRRNYELLQSDVVRTRLRMLFELCDHSSLHLPIRQILLLLTNALLGHLEAKDYVLRARDVAELAQNGETIDGCLYSNVFGGNLPDRRRRNIMVFQYLDRFQIGHETTNRIDNLLIFGEDDESLFDDFQALIFDDPFHAHDQRYRQSKQKYIEAPDEDEEASDEFLCHLVRQRRSMFFRIPPSKESELGLWNLTVFKYGGEYLKEICSTLAGNHRIRPKLLTRIVKGLNRVFTGMLLNDHDSLLLAESGSFTQSRVSRILRGSISSAHYRGEQVVLAFVDGRVMLQVHLDEEHCEDLHLNLVRYEFLSRVAQDGALPASFSKECYEDLLAFKGRIIAAYESMHGGQDVADGFVQIQVLTCNNGRPVNHPINVGGTYA